jgi:hypothetical protein
LVTASAQTSRLDLFRPQLPAHRKALFDGEIEERFQVAQDQITATGDDFIDERLQSPVIYIADEHRMKRRESISGVSQTFKVPLVPARLDREILVAEI